MEHSWIEKSGHGTVSLRLWQATITEDMQMTRWWVPLAFSACILAGCGGGGSSYGTTTPPPSGGTGGSTSNSISVGDNFFNPKATTVAVGTTVTWTWGGSASHNVTFDDGAKSATMASGTYTRTFSTAGTYNYHCTIHGAAMSGTVTVQ